MHLDSPKTKRPLLRHSGNSNLHLHDLPTFDGLPVMLAAGPFIREYLSRLKQTIDLALEQHSRVLAFRVDLRLPLGIDLPDYAYTNEVISRFIASFKAKSSTTASRHVNGIRTPMTARCVTSGQEKLEEWGVRITNC